MSERIRSMAPTDIASWAAAPYGVRRQNGVASPLWLAGTMSRHAQDILPIDPTKPDDYPGTLHFGPERLQAFHNGQPQLRPLHQVALNSQR